MCNFWFLIRKKKVPSVPESLLKRRQRFAAIKAVRQKKAVADKKVGVSNFTCLPCHIYRAQNKCGKHQRRAKIEHASLLMSIGPQSHQKAHLQES